MSFHYLFQISTWLYDPPPTNMKNMSATTYDVYFAIDVRVPKGGGCMYHAHLQHTLKPPYMQYFFAKLSNTCTISMVKVQVTIFIH